MHRLALHVGQEPPHRLQYLINCATLVVLTAQAVEHEVSEVATAYVRPLQMLVDSRPLQVHGVGLEQGGGDPLDRVQALQPEWSRHRDHVHGRHGRSTRRTGRSPVRVLPLSGGFCCHGDGGWRLVRRRAGWCSHRALLVPGSLGRGHSQMGWLRSRAP